MTDNKNCIQCATYISVPESIDCPYIRVNKYMDLCPCSLCMVKSMCNEPCKDYINFMTAASDFKR